MNVSLLCRFLFLCLIFEFILELLLILLIIISFSIFIVLGGYKVVIHNIFELDNREILHFGSYIEDGVLNLKDLV